MFANPERAPASAKAVTLSDVEAEASHPAIPKTGKSFRDTLRRVLLVLAFVVIGAGLSGCGSIREHRDGMGYTVRYDNGFAARPAHASTDIYGDPVRYRDHLAYRPNYDYTRRHRAAHTPPKPTVVVVTAPKPTILNKGRDDEIPVEFASQVSDRHIRSLASRNKMCAESRAGYCSRPNYAHCHGSFCHAHPAGNRKHTHTENDRNNDLGDLDD